MKNGGKMLICAMACIALALAARAAKTSKEPADTSSDKPADTVSLDNPYGAIVERNVFDLHDPPPVKLEPDTPKGPPPNIKLTGITTIFGMKQALLSVNKPGAAGKPPTTIYLTLNEGQRRDDIEMLEINPKARTAKIKSDDMESLLNIETNHTAAGGQLRAAVRPPVAMRQSTPPGFAREILMGATRRWRIPPRPTRTDYQPSAAPTPSAYNPTPYNPGYGGYSPTATQTAPQSQQPQLSPLEQYTLMEAQRAQSQAGQTDPGIAAIMPQTPLGAALNPQSQAAESAPFPTTAPTPQPVLGQHTTGTFNNGGGGVLLPGR